MRYKFIPSIHFVDTFNDKFTDEEIEHEPQLYSASGQFAWDKGGPITRTVLDALPAKALLGSDGRHVVIDTRVHMLMPGMYPAIPGWHCDAWARTENGRGQPDPFDHAGRKNVKHWTAMVGTASKTQFLTEVVAINLNPKAVWSSVSEGLSTMYLPSVVHQESGHIMHFDTEQLHRAMPATERGWRWWFRLSHYQRPPLNRVRVQSQVYTTEHGGW